MIQLSNWKIPSKILIRLNRLVACQGYARDVIDVVEDETGKNVKALLYRGTPDNPAFWKRALLDLPFAAGKLLRACFVFVGKCRASFSRISISTCLRIKR